MNKIFITLCLITSAILLIFPFLLYYGNDIMVVTSDSMIPTLRPNDLLIVKRVGIEEVSVGDIIAFNSHVEDIGIVVHRTIEKFDDGGMIGLQTKGDNVSESDAWVVHGEDLIGKVIGQISYIGILLVEPIRYTLVIIIIITAVILLREMTSEAKLKT